MAGVVYCFKPSVPNNLCKQSCPIPAQGAIMPLFTEAVASHCPHQWSWWIDVWVWYLIKPAQLHNRGTCLALNATVTQARTLHTKIATVFVKQVTWPWINTIIYCCHTGFFFPFLKRIQLFSNALYNVRIKKKTRFTRNAKSVFLW